MNTCGDCKWWKRAAGECHRFPPVVLAWQEEYFDRDSNTTGLNTVPRQLWPKTDADDSCGEFKDPFENHSYLGGPQ